MAKDQGKLFVLVAVLMPHGSCTDKLLQAFPTEERMLVYHIEDEICELRDTTFPLGMNLIFIVHGYGRTYKYKPVTNGLVGQYANQKNRY
jgi:hypothetical protein